MQQRKEEIFYETDQTINHQTNQIYGKMKAIRTEMNMYLSDMKENLEKVFIKNHYFAINSIC